jgi:hypothetical protein
VFSADEDVQIKPDLITLCLLNWAHLEPLLVRNPETSLPKAVKLRCSLCDTVFSASNPSRTASEHLKRGTCPNFNSVTKPISSVSPTSASLASPPPPSRKRHSSAASAGAVLAATAVAVAAQVLRTRCHRWR